MFSNIRVNWFNGLLAVLLVIASAFAMNWRDWHPDVFTGWSLFGFALLALGAALLGCLLVLSLKGQAKWAVPVSFVLGLALGIGAVFFFQKANIGWKETLAGLLAFTTIGGLVAGIAVTKWQKV